MNAEEAAVTFATAGRWSYESDGEVVPVLVLLGEGRNGIIMHPDPGLAPNVPEAYAQIIWRLAKIYPWRMFITVSETWTKSFHPEDALSDSIGRGDLERLHGAGDPLVRTCVHTYALDLKRPSASHSVMSTVVNEDPVEWEITEMPGQADGHMPDVMMRAYLEAPEMPTDKPHGLIPLSLLADALVAAGVATSAEMIMPE